jgi:hypothetical protein
MFLPTAVNCNVVAITDNSYLQTMQNAAENMRFIHVRVLHAVESDYTADSPLYFLTLQDDILSLARKLQVFSNFRL